MMHGIYGQKTSAPQTLDDRVKAEIGDSNGNLWAVVLQKGLAN